MKFTRREVLGLAGGAVTMVALTGLPNIALADKALADKAIAEFTGGAKVGSGPLTLTAPEIAENGNTVPIEVAVEGEMTEKKYVESILILAAGNPRPGVATFKFSPMTPEVQASTRIRLAKTQDLIAVAKMNDGTFYKDQKTVKVTIGGCGG